MVIPFLLSACVSLEEPGLLVPPTVDQDPALQSLDMTVAGHTRAIHYETWGDPENPVILLLHGSLADHRALRRFEALSDRYYVVAWSQRGNGLSERITAEEYGWDSIVEEIDAVRETFAPGRQVTLIGHSFGAMYTALYLTRRPEWVHQAVLMEPGGLTGAIFGETYSDIINIQLWAPGMDSNFWQSEVLSASDHEEVDFKSLQILMDGHQTNYHCDPDNPIPIEVWRPGGHVEWLRGVAMNYHKGQFDYDFASGLKDYTTPVLFIAGDCSALGPTFQETWNMPFFADASLVTIANTGHRMFVEDWDSTLAAIESYLDVPEETDEEDTAP